MTMTTDRRSLLLGSVGVLGLAACGSAGAQSTAGYAPDGKFASSPFRKVSDADWRKRLQPIDSYQILRHEDTEIAGTGPFLNEHRKGTFVCRGCELPLFKSDWKYESGTGWPSFYDTIKANVGVKTDRLLGYPRTEYHCAQCLGHQGHVFPDGPHPTGLRYCNDGVSLRFVPA
jgi:peptide-methionine (R)-S-oxide reductase